MPSEDNLNTCLKHTRRLRNVKNLSLTRHVSYCPLRFNYKGYLCMESVATSVRGYINPLFLSLLLVILYTTVNSKYQNTKRINRWLRRLFQKNRSHPAMCLLLFEETSKSPLDVRMKRTSFSGDTLNTRSNSSMRSTSSELQHARTKT